MAKHTCWGIAQVVAGVWGLGVLAQTAEPAKGSISGTIIDDRSGQPLKKTYLELSGGGGRQEIPVVVSDGEGNFVFAGLAPGEYSITAEKPGYLTATVKNLHLGAGEKLKGVRARLRQMGSISVRVLDADGDPFPFAALEVYRLVFQAGKRRLSLVQNQSGGDLDLIQLLLEPGRYYIAASVPESGGRRLPVSYLPTWYPDALDAGSATPITLTPGESVGDLKIRLRPGRTYRIRGAVSGLPPPADGEPGRVVTARRQSELGDDSPAATALIGEKGTFELSGVAPGSYSLEVMRMQTARGGGLPAPATGAPG